ncbi:MAG: glycine oxidase ThiO [Vicinamibacteria bacterium]
MAIHHPDVVVAGAGIVGLSAACELAKRGARTVVLDRGQTGREASYAAGGILSPQAEAAPDSPLLALALKARARHTALAAELQSQTGIPVEHQTDGVLSLAFSAKEENELRSLTQAQRQLGLRANMVSRDDLRSLESSVHDDAVGAALFPDDHRVDNRRLMDALKALAIKRGVEIAEFTTVRSIESEHGRVTAVRTDHDRIETRAVINALGAWANDLQGCGDTVRIRPVKGHMMALIGGPKVQHVVYGHHGYIVPRMDGRLIVGSTMEEVGFDTVVTAAGIARLISIATLIVPATGQASISEMWTGLRPATPDGLPVIGRGRIEGLVVAGGLFRNGILLGPLVGEMVAALALGETPSVDLSAFRPDRFTSTA